MPARMPLGSSGQGAAGQELGTPAGLGPGGCRLEVRDASDQEAPALDFCCPQIVAFLRKKEDFVSLLLRHIGTSAIMDLLLRLLTCVEQPQLRQDVFTVMAPPFPLPWGCLSPYPTSAYPSSSPAHMRAQVPGHPIDLGYVSWSFSDARSLVTS